MAVGFLYDTSLDGADSIEIGVHYLLTPARKWW